MVGNVLMERIIKMGTLPLKTTLSIYLVLVNAPLHAGFFSLCFSCCTSTRMNTQQQAPIPAPPLTILTENNIPAHLITAPAQEQENIIEIKTDDVTQILQDVRNLTNELTKEIDDATQILQNVRNHNNEQAKEIKELFDIAILLTHMVYSHGRRIGVPIHGSIHDGYVTPYYNHTAYESASTHFNYNQSRDESDDAQPYRPTHGALCLAKNAHPNFHKSAPIIAKNYYYKWQKFNKSNKGTGRNRNGASVKRYS